MLAPIQGTSCVWYQMVFLAPLALSVSTAGQYIKMHSNLGKVDRIKVALDYPFLFSINLYHQR